MRISIPRTIRLIIYAVFFFLMATLVCRADDGKSFSRQMNEIKRSGDYIYSESSAPDEKEAKAACDDLLKIEITKFMTSTGPQSRADARIVKDIADYPREYLVQPRGDMVRVFGYIAKKSISSEDGSISLEAEEKKVDVPIKQEYVALTEEHPAEPSVQTLDNKPKMQEMTPDMRTVSDPLKTDGAQLAKWQTEMLESIANTPDMIQAKKMLNRYKSQNRIKRSGDWSVHNPRPADTFYLIYGRSGNLVALLAPSATSMHFDLLTGATINFNDYNKNPYIWFQISQ